ncbi:transporter substrate-binding protein [Caldalkalibacillus thermarum]|nr:transporter substrate-binding protein [Caldalkalibacillus thermarum]
MTQIEGRELRMNEIRLGLLFSLTGVTSITEQGQYQAARFAIDQFLKHVNKRIKLNVMVCDIRSDPDECAKQAELLAKFGVKVFIGCYTSACRKALLPILERYDALLLYPTLYEGLEAHPNVFYTGEVPNQQILTLLRYMIPHFGRKVYLIGTDYIYPHYTNRQIYEFISQLDGEVVGESYVSFGQSQFNEIVKDILSRKPNAIFSTLVGENIKYFYRCYYDMGLDPAEMPIFSPITSEIEIKAMGEKYAAGHYGCGSYFQSLPSEENHKFIKEFRTFTGKDSVISSVMMNTYIGVRLLLEAIHRTNGDTRRQIFQYLRGRTFQAPSGVFKVDPNNLHLSRQVFIGRANQLGQFELVWASEKEIEANPFFKYQAETPKPLPWKAITNIWKEHSGDILIVLNDKSEVLFASTRAEKLLNVSVGNKVAIETLQKEFNVSVDQVIQHHQPLRVLLGHSVSTQSLEMKKVKNREKIYRFHIIQTKNATYQQTLKLAEVAAGNDANVLILGETGTGKEVMARAIHENSERRDKPFVAVNTGAIPKELIASELFGYVEGAFTGAKKGGAKGKFEQANGGTLFLDEIGEMPLELQVHLLRAIAQKTITRLGDDRERKVNVRIISATNRNLKEEIAYKHTFRADLYYRLNVITLKIPPLRDRKEDIPHLVMEILADLYNQYHKGPVQISSAAVHKLQLHSWPGNIRELKNVIELAFFLAYREKEVRPEHIYFDMEGIENLAAVPKNTTFKLKELEKETIERVLQESSSVCEAAKKLGISRSTLYRRIQQFNIKKQ